MQSRYGRRKRRQKGKGRLHNGGSGGEAAAPGAGMPRGGGRSPQERPADFTTGPGLRVPAEGCKPQPRRYTLHFRQLRALPQRWLRAPYLRRGAALPLPGAASIALRQRSCSEHPGRDHRYIGSLGRLLDLHFELWLATGGWAPGYGPFRQLLQPVPPAPSRWPAAWVERGAQGQEVKQRFL